ncbi:MAG: hypothetical protein E7070_00160 [Bacteroidales bacterium]|nr:hypothetical protein [Bacteroidales bacterium]
MKKIVFPIVFAMANATLLADVITPEQALLLAREVAGDSQSLQIQPSAIANAARSHSLDSTDVSADASDTNPAFYVVSRGQDQGFVIVSGDDCLPPVWGVVEQGNYDENDMPDAFREWIQCRAEQVAYAQANKLNATHTTSEVASDRVDVPYLLPTLWHQSSPYNDRCPIITSNGQRAATGCVATATAQIVYYWRRDANQRLAQTTPTYSYGDAPCTAEFQLQAGTPIKFDLMQTECSNQPAEYKDAVAVLVAACGMTAWLTYGSSTSGQIADCVNVFGAQFGINGGTCVYKNGNYSESGWSKLLYDQLVQGRPLLYCGYNASSGGHAVVCDGYQASTGFFHINFGWGGGYNGYFSVEDGVQGWGFNESSQGCVYDIYPKRPNVTVNVTLPHTIYAKADNNFIFTVTNNGTVALNGLYLFVNTTGTSPSSLSAAQSSATDISIATDATQTLSLTASPTSTGKNYVILTDASLHVLSKTEIQVETNDAQLVADELKVMSSAHRTSYLGQEYEVIYNSRSTVQTLLHNTSSIGFNGYILLNYYHWNDETQAWDFVGTRKQSASVDGNSSGIATSYITTSTVPQLTIGDHYYVELNDSISATQSLDISESARNRVYFTMQKSDMTILGYENRILALGGHFDYTMFNSASFTKKSLYADAVGYDLTQCTAIDRVEQSINPNALYYVADTSKAVGSNIVRGGRATLIELTSGYDFMPRDAFQSDSVRLNLSLTPAQWQLVCVPFGADVPTGMVARQITSHNKNSIINCTSDVARLEPGMTYLVMTSSDRHQTLSGGTSDVTTSIGQQPDGAVHGTFVNMTADATIYQLNSATPQQFVQCSAGTEVPAFGGYLQSADFTKSFNAYGTLLYDVAYIELANSIAEAYAALDQYAEIVTTAAYDAYLAQIEEAETMFSDRTATPTSTEIRNTASALLASAEDYKKQIGDAGNTEIDFTSSITNPSFEEKSTNGWTLGTLDGYSSVGGTFNGTNANAYRGVGLDGQYLFRSLIAKADSTSVGISQTVTGLTPGYYRVAAMVGTDADHSVTLFAGDSTATVAGHPFGPLYLTQAKIDNVLVVADEGLGTGSLTIGIRAGRWYKADNFTLTYTGTLKTDTTDGIEEITSPTATLPDRIFTLDGRSIGHINRSGIYIVGGKKLMVR